MKRIFVTGQCTLHWGRLQYGNIGNYYIVEPLFRELHRVFPNAEIVTTFQMTDEFIKNENVKVLPMDLFYGWKENDLEIAKKEFEIAKNFNNTGELKETTPYIKEVLKSDLIIDCSGEMWSILANDVRKNGFLVGLLKNRTAQLLNKKTVMLGNGEGPFDKDLMDLTKETFEGFDLILNREPETFEVLKEYNLDLSRAKAYACPSFLFEAADDEEIKDILIKEKIKDKNKKTVGFILCGFNFLEAPYDKPRKDEEFTQFAEAIEHIINDLNCRVVLLSHSNGFELPPNFKLINGRDYKTVKQLYDVLLRRGKIDEENLHLIANPYIPKLTKAIIRNFDMLVTGRLHASVAGLSQYVPTVNIIYGNGPKAHKTIGFFKIAGTEEYISSPHNSKNIIEKIDLCFNNLEKYREHLKKRIPEVQKIAREQFDLLKTLDEGTR